MNQYNAYGLNIVSDVRLPFLESHVNWHGNRRAPSADVTIHFNADSAGNMNPPNGKNALWKISREHAEMTVKDMGTFHVSRGKNITIHPVSCCNKDVLEQIIVNSLLAVALYQRKILVLHASAIQIGSKTVAFLGSNGAGKSLIAASLIARGHKMVSDDVAALSLRSSQTYIQPGFPIIKMRPQEYKMLGFNGLKNNCLPVNKQKVGYIFGGLFFSEPSRLECVFVLDVGNDRKIRQLSPKESFMQLICNSPPVIWDMLPDELHFSHIASLTQNVPVYMMTREENLEKIPEHAEMIEEYIIGGMGEKS
jgi:hypothetical protein